MPYLILSYLIGWQSYSEVAVNHMKLATAYSSLADSIKSFITITLF